jgi:PiT family inorganic phosphate transporter
LIVVGALASYSLGANNIGNVMGMFASAPLFADLRVGTLLTISGVQQLFFLGGLAIAIGIFTYGEAVMDTVGKDLYKISPLTGLIVVFAEFLVLTLFTSETLESILISAGLPSFPLVPLSTTQAFIGAVIGVGLAKDPLSINFRVLGKIALGWVIAPISAGIITFLSLFFVQNVFEQKVIHPVPYEISPSVVQQLQSEGIPTDSIGTLIGARFDNKKVFRNELMSRAAYSSEQIFKIFQYSIIDSILIDTTVVLTQLPSVELTEEQYRSLHHAHGMIFNHKIDFEHAVFDTVPGWNAAGDKLLEKQLSEKKLKVLDVLRIQLESKLK